MAREVITTVGSVLSMVSSVEDMGGGGSWSMSWYADLLGHKLDESEIEEYARSVEALDGFCEEDYEEVKERLADFRARYIRTPEATPAGEGQE